MDSANELFANFEAYMASEECARHQEWVRETLAAKDSFEAYWAGSVSASVMRDYKAGRVVNV
jgi:hypothetical protein